MKKSRMIIAMLGCLFCGVAAQGQEMVVDGFRELPGYIVKNTDMSKRRVDANGHLPALVLVSIASEEAKFSGQIVGPVEKREGEYCVYMVGYQGGGAARNLTVIVPGYKPLHVEFEPYGYKQLSEDTAYRLSITLTGSGEENTVYKRIGKAMELYKVKQYDAAAAMLVSLEKELKQKGIVYQKVGEWIGRCKVANVTLTLGADTVFPMSEGVCRYRSKEQYGFVDSIGNVIKHHTLQDASDFRNGVAWVKEKDKWGCIDRNGFYFVQPQYDQIWFLHDNKMGYSQNRCLLVRKNKHYGLVDVKTGDPILPVKYDIAYGECASFICLAMLNDKYGWKNGRNPILIDLASGTEKVKLPKGHRFAGRLYDDYFLVEKDVKYYEDGGKGIMHYRDGMILDSNKYCEIRLIDNNRIRYSSPYVSLCEYIYNRNYQIYNLQTRSFVGGENCWFSEIYPHSYPDDDVPYIQVRLIDSYAVQNLKTGKVFGHTTKHYGIKIPYHPEDPIVVRKEDGTYFYDRNENEYKAPFSEGIFDEKFKFEYTYHFWGGFAVIKQNGKYGYINAKGEIVLPCEYYEASDFSPDWSIGGRRIATVYVDEKSKELQTPTYIYIDDDGILRTVLNKSEIPLRKQ